MTSSNAGSVEVLSVRLQLVVEVVLEYDLGLICVTDGRWRWFPRNYFCNWLEWMPWTACGLQMTVLKRRLQH